MELSTARRIDGFCRHGMPASIHRENEVRQNSVMEAVPGPLRKAERISDDKVHGVAKAAAEGRQPRRQPRRKPDRQQRRDLEERPARSNRNRVCSSKHHENLLTHGKQDCTCRASSNTSTT